jgi:hypothetical protein
VQELENHGLKLPEKLEQWKDFNIEGAWMPEKNRSLVRRVKNLNFYMRHAYASTQSSPARKVLQGLSRMRCERDFYGFPVERYVAEAFRRF